MPLSKRSRGFGIGSSAVTRTTERGESYHKHLAPQAKSGALRQRRLGLQVCRIVHSTGERECPGAHVQRIDSSRQSPRFWAASAVHATYCRCDACRLSATPRRPKLGPGGGLLASIDWAGWVSLSPSSASPRALPSRLVAAGSAPSDRRAARSRRRSGSRDGTSSLRWATRSPTPEWAAGAI